MIARLRLQCRNTYLGESLLRNPQVVPDPRPRVPGPDWVRVGLLSPGMAFGWKSGTSGCKVLGAGRNLHSSNFDEESHDHTGRTSQIDFRQRPVGAGLLRVQLQRRKTSQRHLPILMERGWVRSMPAVSGWGRVPHPQYSG